MHALLLPLWHPALLLLLLLVVVVVRWYLRLCLYVPLLLLPALQLVQ
jgi:hypothetical protein